MRARLIFLFRLLQVNTLSAMDPYNHYDETPDHLVAGRAAEAVCWTSGGAKDYPEHYKAGRARSGPPSVWRAGARARAAEGRKLSRPVAFGPLPPGAFGARSRA
jgi:hypothetical protein